MKIKVNQKLLDVMLQGKNDIEFTLNTLQTIYHISPNECMWVQNNFNVFNTGLIVYQMVQDEITETKNRLWSDLKELEYLEKKVEFFKVDHDYFLQFTVYVDGRKTDSAENRFYNVKCSLALTRYLKLQGI